MTSAVESVTGSAVVPYSGDMAGLGLEDVTAADLSVPRLNILGKTATFENSQTKEKFTELDAVLICQVKQRVMWNKDPHKDYKYPQCRSTDFQTGFPNVDPKAPTDNGGYGFPWAEGNFDPVAGRQGLYIPDALAQTGLPALPCDKCKLKEWEGGKTRCREQHVYPLFYRDPSSDLWVPAVLTIQGAGIVPSRTYIGGFAAARQPLFTVITHLKLKPASRGAVDYAIPEFTKTGGSDPSMYEEYANQVGVMRSYLRRWPTARDEVEPVSEVEAPSNLNTGPVIEHVPAPTPVAAQPTPAGVQAQPLVTPAVSAPVLTPPTAPSLPEPTPVQQPASMTAPVVPAAPVEPPPPPGYEAMWATMPPAAKDAILAAQAPAVAPSTPSATPVAPSAPVPPTAAPAAASITKEDLPF